MVNSSLNKQFLRRAFELPAAGIDRWLQSKIRRAFITFRCFNDGVGSRDSGSEQCVGLFNALGKIEHGLKIIGINEILLAMRSERRSDEFRAPNGALSCFDDRAPSMRRSEQSQSCSNGGPIIQEFKARLAIHAGTGAASVAPVANADQSCAYEVLQRGWPGSNDDNRQLWFAAMADAIHNCNDSSRMETASQSELDVLGVKKSRSGKVREVFNPGDRLLFVATDRLGLDGEAHSRWRMPRARFVTFLAWRRLRYRGKSAQFR